MKKFYFILLFSSSIYCPFIFADLSLSAPTQAKGEQSEYRRLAVKNTITKKAEDVALCYREFFKKNPKASPTDGTMSFDWQIRPNGKTLQPEFIEGTLDHLGLKTCIVSKIKKWEFPSPPGDRNYYVTHKFFFNNDKQKVIPENK